MCYGGGGGGDISVWVWLLSQLADKGSPQHLVNPAIEIYNKADS